MGALLLGWVGLKQVVVGSLQRHPWGWAAVVLAILLSLPGIRWGYYECWNYDQMAHLELREDGLPEHYLKPPLHTFLNQAILVPVTEWSMRHVFNVPRRFWNEWRLLASRMLTVGMFAAGVWFVYRCALRCGDHKTAGMLALLLATSSGVLVFNRFLSADAPLMFWMPAALLAALKAGETGKLRWAIGAGLLAGLAVANKYNALAVGFALPVTLLLAGGWKVWKSPSWWLGGFSVPVGFALGNPGVLFDTHRFLADFSYNLASTPVYQGQQEGASYGTFFLYFPELIGIPVSLLFGLCILGSAVLVCLGKAPKSGLPLLAACGAVCLFYYATMGRFPRMETRFVLPIIPFVLLLGIPFFDLLRHRVPKGLGAAVLMLVLFNVAASVEAGLRFRSDPRMPAWKWVYENIPGEALVENSYAPHWRRIPNYRVEIVRMPTATGRAEIFLEMFGEDPRLAEAITRHETPPDTGDAFTEAGLVERNPDFIAFSSQVFEWTGDPVAREYYEKLDRGDHPRYKKVFERRWRSAASWSYPAEIDFLVERMVILERRAE